MVFQDVDPITVKSTLSVDGILSIKGPKKIDTTKQEHAIPIQHTSSVAPTIKSSSITKEHS